MPTQLYLVKIYTYHNLTIKSATIIVVFTNKHQVKYLSWQSNQNNPITDGNSFSCMGLLPETQNCGCACTGNTGNVFPVIAGKRFWHASRHVRAVMHAGIANQRFPLKSAAGENVPGIPGACSTCNFTYLVRGTWNAWAQSWSEQRRLIHMATSYIWLHTFARTSWTESQMCAYKDVPHVGLLFLKNLGQC